MPDSARRSFGRDAVLKQVPFFREHFGCVDSHWKPDRTRVTEVDLRISREVLADLSAAFPGDSAVSEETPPEAKDSEYCWVLDPVDGTNNYACGLPSCAISLGLLHNGMPVYGWIYDHGLDRLFHGGPGLGVFQDETRIQPVRTVSVPGQRLVAVHFPLPEKDLDRLGPVLARCKVRSLGSAALNLLYVALGRMDGVIEQGIKVWDIAAAAAIARECGLEMVFRGGTGYPWTEPARFSDAIAYAAGDAAEDVDVTGLDRGAF